MSKNNREKFEAWGVSDTDLRITLECETYAGIAWLAWQAATKEAEAKLTALTSQLESVVAENAALKSKGREVLKEAAYVYSHYNRMVDHLDGESVDGQTLHEFQEVIESQTPATSAFLAEVRASGVEMFASHLRTNDNGASVCKMIALGADEFAAQLRQGGAV